MSCSLATASSPTSLPRGTHHAGPASATPRPRGGDIRSRRTRHSHCTELHHVADPAILCFGRRERRTHRKQVPPAEFGTSTMEANWPPRDWALGGARQRAIGRTPVIPRSTSPSNPTSSDEGCATDTLVPARVGLVGNPSDGHGRAVLAAIVDGWAAEAVATTMPGVVRPRSRTAGVAECASRERSSPTWPPAERTRHTAS